MISIPAIFSLRATHGAHTINFAPWDKGDSGVYINKTTQVAYKIMKSNCRNSGTWGSPSTAKVGPLHVGPS